MNKTKESLLTQKDVRDLFYYNENTGVFLWRIKTSNIKPGMRAGCDNGYGYIQVSIRNNLYLQHRLVWLYVYGEFPPYDIDHINGIRDDNRITNLRKCTRSENFQNLSMRKTNKSGYIGVSWHKKSGKWRSYISCNNKTTHLGLFDTPEEASKAYLKAKSDLHTFNPVPRGDL